MTGNNKVSKTIWKNGNKEYNEKYKCCLFTKWNLKSEIMYKCGQVVLSHASGYFAISKLVLLFSYFFMYHPLYFLTFIFTLHVPCFPLFLIDHSQKQVLLNKRAIFFLKLKNVFFALFNFLKLVIFSSLFRRWSTLWNSTLKITALFWRRLTLLISTLK